MRRILLSYFHTTVIEASPHRTQQALAVLGVLASTPKKQKNLNTTKTPSKLIGDHYLHILAVQGTNMHSLFLPQDYGTCMGAERAACVSWHVRASRRQSASVHWTTVQKTGQKSRQNGQVEDDSTHTCLKSSVNRYCPLGARCKCTSEGNPVRNAGWVARVSYCAVSCKAVRVVNDRTVSTNLTVEYFIRM